MTTETAPAVANPDQLNVNDVPCTIYMTNGCVFSVEKVSGWTYVPQGIFASGHFIGEETDRDLLIPDHSVEYMELDFEALKRYGESDASPSA